MEWMNENFMMICGFIGGFIGLIVAVVNLVRWILGMSTIDGDGGIAICIASLVSIPIIGFFIFSVGVPFIIVASPLIILGLIAHVLRKIILK